VTSRSSPASTSSTLPASSAPCSRSQSLPGVPVGRASAGSGSVFGSSSTGGTPARSAASPGSARTAFSSAVSLRASSSRSPEDGPSASTWPMSSWVRVLSSRQAASSSASENSEV
jgi:hypothetical protein